MNRIVLFALMVFGARAHFAAMALPIFTSQPFPLTNSVSLGASLTNRVTATSALGQIHYQWKLNGVDLLTQTNAMLILSNIQTGNGGIYTAVAKDDSGSVESIENRII